MKNTKNTITRAAIMRTAHALTRAALRSAYPFRYDYRATFAAALRLAWAGSAAEIWAAMDGEAQLAALVSMTWAAKKRDDAEEQEGARKMRWIVSQDDAQTNAAEAWLEMIPAVERASENGEPLALALFRAVMTAAQRIDRQERRNARALRVTEDRDDATGATVRREYIETQAQPMSERSFTDPESTAIFFDDLAACTRDNTDRAIIEALAAGYTQREIAAFLAVSQPAVAKRIKAMKERRAAA